MTEYHRHFRSGGAVEKQHGMRGCSIALAERIRSETTGRGGMTYAGELTDRRNEVHGIDPRQPRAITDALSPRETAILELIAQGHSNKTIARILGISPETVKTHVKNLFVKLGVEKRAQAVARAFADAGVEYAAGSARQSASSPLKPAA
jgi:DNA-binding NarL/FixJ family response regulator